MNNLVYFLILVLGLGCVGLIAHQQDMDVLNSVLSGDSTLRCSFVDGTRTVPSDRVKDYYSGKWIFDNGYSSSCTVSK